MFITFYNLNENPSFHSQEQTAADRSLLCNQVYIWGTHNSNQTQPLGWKNKDSSVSTYVHQLKCRLLSSSITHHTHTYTYTLTLLSKAHTELIEWISDTASSQLIHLRSLNKFIQFLHKALPGVSQLSHPPLISLC